MTTGSLKGFEEFLATFFRAQCTAGWVVRERRGKSLRNQCSAWVTGLVVLEGAQQEEQLLEGLQTCGI